MTRWWWKKRARRLKERQRAAEAEMERSRELLRQARRKTAPIRAAEEHNQFAEMVRRALAQGWEQR